MLHKYEAPFGIYTATNMILSVVITTFCSHIIPHFILHKALLTQLSFLSISCHNKASNSSKAALLILIFLPNDI